MQESRLAARVVQAFPEAPDARSCSSLFARPRSDHLHVHVHEGITSLARDCNCILNFLYCSAHVAPSTFRTFCPGISKHTAAAVLFCWGSKPSIVPFVFSGTTKNICSVSLDLPSSIPRVRPSELPWVCCCSSCSGLNLLHQQQQQQQQHHHHHHHPISLSLSLSLCRQQPTDFPPQAQGPGGRKHRRLDKTCVLLQPAPSSILRPLEFCCLFGVCLFLVGKERPKAVVSSRTPPTVGVRSLLGFSRSRPSIHSFIHSLCSGIPVEHQPKLALA
ncbi:hypothetical protein Mp_3g04310 [Marchantia polymorpha subsp. ruderalis]|uniref:Uncharacterized protein n=2 Tax=Marchantia polymorpha TaxID=3197 RepID=A0AAF6AXC2_MARPO|nr:hypothetical protein MARPO_0022s0100 [Marchantia polymorpha]BBN04406.1 hypothetical protein Mp_3g04310 [Marchantia polymorpha subsp. ruderalis]|eukprot:PTQ43998.1 hypothetical protein MARPO_0022s0100 [Marchantia polymorpha]